MALLGTSTSRGLSLGRVAGIPVRVTWTWFLVAAVLAVVVAPIAEARVPGLGSTGALLAGLAFAVLLYGSVFVHELAHAVVGQRLGLGVRSITISLLGGLTEFTDDDPSPGRDALVAVAGPVASLVIALAAWQASRPLDVPGPDGLGRFLLLELAVASLLVGLFNLLPTLPLDGGHLLKDAIWAVTGRPGPGYVVAGGAGFVLAAALLALPWLLSRPEPPALFSLAWSVLLAVVVGQGARGAVQYGRLHDRLPRVSTSALVKPVVAAPPDLPLDEAVRRVHSTGAAGVVVVDADGRPLALTDEASVSAMPPARWPHVTVAAVSRALPVGAGVPQGLDGLALLRRLQQDPAGAHVVVDGSGRAVGLLLARDVDAALVA